MEMACVDCAVKTESLKIIQDNFRLERVNMFVRLYTQIVNIFIYLTHFKSLYMKIYFKDKLLCKIIYHYVQVHRHKVRRGFIFLRTKCMYVNFTLANYLCKVVEFMLSWHNLKQFLGWWCISMSKGRFTHSMPCPCRSPAMPCREGFGMCLSHLIYTVRSCLIHTCHAAPMPCSEHAVLLKATAQHGRLSTAVLWP